MFFIMGIDQKEKMLEFTQSMLCKSCGSYGRIEVFMTYMCFSLFFIPLFKWNKRYFVRTTCCSKVCEIDRELGDDIARGNVTSINIDSLNFQQGYSGVKTCRNCGYQTAESFQYCPNCGQRF